MICGSEFATVLFPVSTTWMVRKLQGCHRKTTGLIQMTGMTFHRGLKSEAVFHISPTCFHFKIWKEKDAARTTLPRPLPSFLLVCLRFQATLLMLLLLCCIHFPHTCNHSCLFVALVLCFVVWLLSKTAHSCRSTNKHDLANFQFSCWLLPIVV